MRHLKINLDSELVSGQLVGAFEVKDSQMKSYRDTTKSLMTEFRHIKIEAIKRELNSWPNALEKFAAYGKYLKKNRTSDEGRHDRRERNRKTL